MLRGSRGEDIKLTQDLRCVDSGGVDAQRAEVALCLQDKNEGGPSEHGSSKTQTLHQTRGKGEAVTHPQSVPRHGGTDSLTQEDDSQTLYVHLHGRTYKNKTLRR